MSVSTLRYSRRTGILLDVVQVLFFANLTAVAARLAVHLPFSPVPVTGQTLAVLLAGAALGWRRGALSQLAYLVEGAAGLPVFAGGTAGLAVLVGPTAGYLVGFVFAAALIGALLERPSRPGVPATLLAMTLGSAVVYLFGVAWLSHFIPGGLTAAIVVGIVPYLPGDLLKILIASGVVPGARRIVARE